LRAVLILREVAFFYVMIVMIMAFKTGDPSDLLLGLAIWLITGSLMTWCRRHKTSTKFERAATLLAGPLVRLWYGIRWLAQLEVKSG
jgi:hypothetical protein